MTLMTPDSPLFAVLPDEEAEVEHCYACDADICRCDALEERRERDCLEAWA